MSLVFFLFMLATVSVNAQVGAPCSRYVAKGGKCGGIYFCWDSAENCKNELNLLLNVCCVNGTKCMRTDTDEWRCRGVNNTKPVEKASPTPAPPNSSSSAKVFSSTMTTLHNYYRQRHQVSPVIWDTGLASKAKQIANKCSFDTVGFDRDYGQNLFMSYSGNKSPTEIGREAVTDWYKNIARYDYDNATFSMETGTATCVVWKSVKRIGCAASSCAKSTTYLACLYDPPCNVLGQFEDNVFPIVRP